MSDRSIAPLWLKWISFGIRPGISFSDRRLLYLVNGPALANIGVSFIFMLDNIRRPDLWMLIPYNVALILTGSLALLLVWRGFFRTAFWMQLLVCCAIFTYTGAEYFNTTENYLLLLMGAAVFVVERPSLRLIVAFLTGTAFLYVKVLHYHVVEIDPIPLDRYLLNTGTFVVVFYGFLEIIRRIFGDYLQQIEASNRELVRQRAVLAAERARLTSANQAKEKLFSIVSHDLRGPVGNLKLALDSVQEGSLQARDFSEMQSELKLGVDRVYRSLDDLLHWAAGQMEALDPELQNGDLRPIAEEAVGLLMASAAAKHIQLDNQLDPEIRVHADRHQVGSIFRNLVANAIKFTPENGRVGLHAEWVGERWQISVTDTGVGMTPAALKELFDGELIAPTRGTSNERGWGLGLQICREFVAANGGTLSAKSVPGEGTTFYFTLAPAAEATDAG